MPLHCSVKLPMLCLCRAEHCRAVYAIQRSCDALCCLAALGSALPLLIFCTGLRCRSMHCRCLALHVCAALRYSMQRHCLVTLIVAVLHGAFPSLSTVLHRKSPHCSLVHCLCPAMLCGAFRSLCVVSSAHAAFQGALYQSRAPQVAHSLIGYMRSMAQRAFSIKYKPYY